jgi:hypothetical protein
MREALNSKHQAFSKFSSPAFSTPDTSDMGPGKGPIQVPPEQKDFLEGVWSVEFSIIIFAMFNFTQLGCSHVVTVLQSESFQASCSLFLQTNFDI